MLTIGSICSIIYIGVLSCLKAKSTDPCLPQAGLQSRDDKGNYKLFL